MSNIIEVYKKNSNTVNCTVKGLDTLDGYVATMTVKKYKEDLDADKKFTVNGTIAALVATFKISSANNEIADGDYFYEVTLIKATEPSARHTVIQDIYRVLDTLED